MFMLRNQLSFASPPTPSDTDANYRRSAGAVSHPAGPAMEEGPEGTKWKDNAILYEYAKESKPVRCSPHVLQNAES